MKNFLLLALSGGPDSRMLLHQLLQKPGIVLHIAHVDHGWRKESAQEAAQLALLAKEYGLPFHLRVLDPAQMSGNLEEACRNERMRFFKELVEEYGFHAVVLGHHADDRAETILKRMLEGADFLSLASMQEESTFEGMVLWRPLIHTRKSEILKFLEKHGIVAFHDKSNEDRRFLRARMRQQILPNLAQVFGKEVTSSLLHLGDEAKELDAYLDRRTSDVWSGLVSGPFGDFLDLTGVDERYELGYLIKKLGRRHKAMLTRPVRETLMDWVSQRVANKKIYCDHQCWYVDRGILFFLRKDVVGKWRIVEGGGEVGGWREAWKGRACVFVKEKNYELVDSRGHVGVFDKLWTGCRVPSCVRLLVPVVVCEGGEVHEFLSGRRKVAAEGHCVSIEYFSNSRLIPNS